jgi:magnesium chelatase subunit D
MLELIAQICIDMNVDGHRADITMMKTASTISALNSRTEVSEEDIRETAELVLSHRMRRKPFEEQSDNRDKLDETFEKHKEKQQDDEEETERSEDTGQNNDGGSDDGGGMPDSPSETTFETGETFQLRPMSAEHELKNRDGSGRRSKTRTNSKSGRYVKSAIPHEKTTDIGFDATFRAAAPNQLGRAKDGKAIALHQSDIREKVREKKIGNTILFVVDASGSMGARERMRAVKGAVLSLLIDAYQKRDRVGLIAFKDKSAELLLLPTSSVELANKYLQDLPTGGKHLCRMVFLRDMKSCCQRSGVTRIHFHFHS